MRPRQPRLSLQSEGRSRIPQQERRIPRIESNMTKQEASPAVILLLFPEPIVLMVVRVGFC